MLRHSQDTAGEERFRALTRSFYRGAHAAILVYDVSCPESFEQLQSFRNDIRAAVPYDVVLLLVGTKIDLKDKKLVEESKARKFAKSINAKHFAVSSVLNIGVGLSAGAAALFCAPGWCGGNGAGMHSLARFCARLPVLSGHIAVRHAEMKPLPRAGAQSVPGSHREVANTVAGGPAARSGSRRAEEQ